MRPTIDQWWQLMARVASQRGSCMLQLLNDGVHLPEGCVLVDAVNRPLAMGYRGRARGQQNCADPVIVTPALPGATNPAGWSSPAYSVTYPHRCVGDCEGVHAEQAALELCADRAAIRTLYTLREPCIECVRLLLGTGCTRIVFELPDPADRGDAAALWTKSGCIWVRQSPT